MVALTIDNNNIQVPEGTTILEAARKIGIRIPTLCACSELHHTPGACRVCVVEVERSRTLVASCVYPVTEGMRIKTNSERVRRARRCVVELLLSDHPQDCNSGSSDRRCNHVVKDEFETYPLPLTVCCSINTGGGVYTGFDRAELRVR